MNKIVKLFILLILGSYGCSKGNPGDNPEDINKSGTPLPFIKVECDLLYNNPGNWKTYTARTIDRLPGFDSIRYKAVQQSEYGGWKIAKHAATGFFRIEKLSFGNNSRWFIIDPEGYPYIHRAIATFNPGGSERQRTALKTQFGNNAGWAQKESETIRKYGFNGAGAWSNHAELRKLSNPPAYCIFLRPMAYLKEEMALKGETWPNVMPVWDPRFDAFLESEMAKTAQYKDDKYLVGYWSDNEQPWHNNALDLCLTKFATDNPNYIAAKTWLDTRKGKNASLADVNQADRQAFLVYNFETYIKKVSETLRKYDPNHLFLGTKFHREDEELINPGLLQVAGRYSDIISIDHYRQWEPDSTMMVNWESWSGKPFMIVEFYVKGMDSGLPNNTGAGSRVRTQADRGYWYQNFTMKLLSSTGCVGWHWFMYQDNDPTNPKNDKSNVDSNKGIVTWDFKPYLPLLDNMKQLNDNTLNLIYYFGYDINLVQK
jgi:hypothetical protein